MAGKGSGKKTGGKTGSPAKPLTPKDSASCIVNKVTVHNLCDSLNQLKISLGQTPDQQQKPDSVNTREQVDTREVISCGGQVVILSASMSAASVLEDIS